MVIFVTGGAGYIGSHTILELLNNGHDVVSIDNFVNSSIESLKRVEQITNKKIISYFYFSSFFYLFVIFLDILVIFCILLFFYIYMMNL